VDVPAGAYDVGLERFQVEVQVLQRVVLDVPPGVAQRLELRRFATAALRRAMNCGLLNASAFCSPLSARAARAFCLKAGEVVCTGAVSFPAW